MNSNFKWDHIFNSIKDSIILLDVNGIIKECNTAFLKLVDKSETQVFGYDCSKIIYGKTTRKENCLFLKSKKSKKRESLNILIKDRLYKVSVDPILDENNEISGFVQFMSDITEHKEFQESEEKYRTLAENINVGIYRNTVGKKGKFIEANTAIVKMFGFRNRSEFLEHNVSELYLHPEERNKFNNKMLQKGFIKDEELQLKRKDGTAFYGSISAVTIKDKDGYIQFYDGIIEDITERKKADIALLESENNLRTIFHAMTNLVMEIDYDGRYINIAPTSPELLYKSSVELIGKKLHDVFPKPTADMFLKSFHKCLSENKTIIIEYPLIINKKTIWFEGRITPKTKNSILLIAHDMTERKHATTALRKSENNLRTIFNAMTDIVMEIDFDGRYIDIAPTSPGLLYKPSAKLIGKKLHDVFPKPTADMFLKSFHKCLSENKIIIIEYSLIINKKTIWFEGRITPKTKNSILLIAHDMTERKRAEEALSMQNLKYYTLLLNLEGMVYNCENDKNWTMKFVSAGCLKLTGYKPEELIENSKQSFNDLILPKYQDSIWELWQKNLKSHEPVEVEYEIKTASGEIKWVWERGRGIYSENGKLTHLEGLITDITERKHNEKIQEIIFNISTAIPVADSLEKLIELIHKELGKIIDTTNFFIAFYDKETNTFSLPFFTDTKDKTITFPAEKTLTNYVRITKKPLLANKKLKNRLMESSKIERIGVDAKVWLGVPLKVERKITGVLAVQSYTDEFAFDKSDLKMLEFISSQISISIERKKAELEIQESEERYKYLFNQSPTSIWEEDFSKVYKYLTSLKQRGIKNIKEYFENNLNETRKCSQMVQILDVNERTIALFNANDKKELISNLSSIFIEDSLPAFIEQLCIIAQNKTNFNGDCINKTLDGKLINVAIKWNVVPGYEKNYSKVLISLIDITEQKKAQEELRIGRERLKLLNQVIRHDIANDFIVIKSAVNIFRRSSDVTILDEIEKRVMKSIKTIENYKKYEEFIDLNASLKEVGITKLIDEIIVEFPNIKFNIEGKCKVFADDALNSVFMNLITNSIKHGNSTQIDIIISSNDKMCEIRFADNGVGIPDKYKNRIFDKGFFYGKSGNTGMGLYIVRKTIERLGGSIFIEDNKPNGAVFLINLRKSLRK